LSLRPESFIRSTRRQDEGSTKLLHNSASRILRSNSNGLRDGWPGFDSKRGPRNSYFLHSVQTDSGAHPSPGVKRPWHEADHSPPASAEVRNAWSYASTPPHVLMA
jgi:hypothetical protein